MGIIKVGKYQLKIMRMFHLARNEREHLMVYNRRQK